MLVEALKDGDISEAPARAMREHRLRIYVRGQGRSARLSAQKLPVANGSFASDLQEQQVKAEHVAGPGLSVWKRTEPRSPHQLRTADPESSRELARVACTEFFKWWIVDERTGKRSLSSYLLTRADAARAFPGAEPDVRTREIRDLPDAGQLPATSRPGRKWW
jgi:hypothetical protein